MPPGNACIVHWYRNIFSHVPSTKGREIAAMLKAIHAGEVIVAARQKAVQVIEKMRLANVAELVQRRSRRRLLIIIFRRSAGGVSFVRPAVVISPSTVIASNPASTGKPPIRVRRAQTGRKPARCAARHVSTPSPMCNPWVTFSLASILIAADLPRPSILRSSFRPSESRNVR